MKAILFRCLLLMVCTAGALYGDPAASELPNRDAPEGQTRQTRFGTVTIVHEAEGFASRILLDGMPVKRIDGVFLHFDTAAAYPLAGADGTTEDVIVLSYAEGAGYMMRRLLSVDKTGVTLHRPMGNGHEEVRTVAGPDTLTFLYTCNYIDECYERYFTHVCRYSAARGLRCEGQGWCSYAETDRTFYALNEDENVTDTVRTVTCPTDSSN